MSREIDATTGLPIDVMRVPEEMSFRVDADTLISGQEVELVVFFNEASTAVGSVTLRFDAYRSELLKWVKSGQIPLDVPTLIRFAPMKPITVQLTGTPELCAPFEPALMAGRTLTECLSAAGDEGFPAFFDLQNYHYKGVFQRG